jgi:hypothetical protein
MNTTFNDLLHLAALGAVLLLLNMPVASNAAEPKPYPLKVCLVTDNELGSMGKPITKVYDGQEIKFCCKPCIKKFEANKAKFLAKLPK